MLTTVAPLFDIEALGVVVAGTWLATAARCGWGDLVAAISAAAKLGSAQLDANANRAALARTASSIREKGPLCTDTPLPPDRPLARAAEAYLSRGSIEALQSTARAERIARASFRDQGLRVFEHAGELAPVFGLVGTLFAITQLTPTQALGTSETALAAVGTAVLSSLYGVLTAHFIYFPTARAIERRGDREERERSDILDWFEGEITRKRPRKTSPLKSAA